MDKDSFISSSIKKPVISQNTVDPPEESGWTTYLEDFSKSGCQNQDDHQEFSSFCTSLLSDAASRAHWQISNNKNNNNYASEVVSKNLNAIKKSKAKRISYEDPLEDTASSPVNSPKVSNTKWMDMNTKPDNDSKIDHFLGKEGNSQQSLELQPDERKEMVFRGQNTDSASLKKRGLCVVPISMFVNYNVG